MKGIPQGRYTKEFRQEAVKLVMEEGLSWGEAARRLSLPTSTLANWVKAAKAGKLGEVGKNSLLRLVSRSSIYRAAYRTNLGAVRSVELLDEGNMGVATGTQETFIRPYAPLVVWRPQCHLSLRRDDRSTAKNATPR